jgi:hypothetical protein
MAFMGRTEHTATDGGHDEPDSTVSAHVTVDDDRDDPSGDEAAGLFAGGACASVSR